ncbi:unnamed protein product, partial [Polarella glacialis]
QQLEADADHDEATGSETIGRTAAEVYKVRQQMDELQAELLARYGGEVACEGSSSMGQVSPDAMSLTRAREILRHAASGNARTPQDASADSEAKVNNNNNNNNTSNNYNNNSNTSNNNNNNNNNNNAPLHQPVQGSGASLQFNKNSSNNSNNNNNNNINNKNNDNTNNNSNINNKLPQRDLSPESSLGCRSSLLCARPTPQGGSRRELRKAVGVLLRHS